MIYHQSQLQQLNGNKMKELEEKILKEGAIINNDIIKVDAFINHRIDVVLAKKLGAYFASNFPDADKVLTLETSGIVFGFTTAEALGDVPMVFAKKRDSATIDRNACYKAIVHSFTHGNDALVTVNKAFLNKGDKVLIVDDFLANGSAATGLIDICKQAGAIPVGFCTVIEKSFQPGRKLLEDMGIKVISGARIKAFENNIPIFVEE